MSIAIMAAGALVFVLACIGVGILIANTPQTSEIEQGVAPNAPDFPAVLPANKKIDSLGGWQKLISPDGETFYVFLDTLDGVPIKVSQQELPATLKDDIDSSIAEVAMGYNATDTLTANGTKAYIGTSAKGPQSVIFARNNVLVLLVSEQKIQDESWITYISSLK